VRLENKGNLLTHEDITHYKLKFRLKFSK
jgi:hypothetical protein